MSTPYSEPIKDGREKIKNRKTKNKNLWWSVVTVVSIENHSNYLNGKDSRLLKDSVQVYFLLLQSH